jgi:hypothetical protein
LSVARLSGTGRAQALHLIDAAVGGILSRRNRWLWPQYWHATETIGTGFGGVLAGLFGSGMFWPQALHLADLMLAVSLASSNV